ncbi:MAG: HipA domain-containing protein [Gemmatimonadaceae bacterium]
MALPAHLLVLLDGRQIGVLSRSRTGELRFEYDEAWRRDEAAIPLSLALPLAQRLHAHEPVVRLLHGYLPDRRETREALATEHQVSAEDPFSLLSVVGEDCPGAVQFVRPERLSVLATGDADGVAWLSDAELAERLRLLRTPGAPGRLRGDAGYFSLAGAQPKVALFCADGRWGIPAGRLPTTHILKPPLGGQAKYLVAEYVALRLAYWLDLIAPEAHVVSADDQLALAIRRYDREYDPTTARWTRWHQEDLAQAMGEPTAVRYEAQGAPGIAQVVAFLRERSSDPAADESRFLRAVALNWILIGTDAHLRNFSVLLGARGDVRLAPFYDVASALDIARRPDLDSLKLAMQIGGEYRAAEIAGAHWAALEHDLGYAAGALLSKAIALAEAIPEALTQVARELATAPPAVHTPGQRLARRIAQRTRTCLRALRAG